MSRCTSYSLLYCGSFAFILSSSAIRSRGPRSQWGGGFLSQPVSECHSQRSFNSSIRTASPSTSTGTDVRQSYATFAGIMFPLLGSASRLLATAQGSWVLEEPLEEVRVAFCATTRLDEASTKVERRMVEGCIPLPQV